MTVLDGLQFTQLNNLNVIGELYNHGAPFSGGGISGPGTTTLTAIPRWGDTGGGSLDDSGNLIDANNNMYFNLQGSETTVGIFWDDGAEDIRQYYDSAGLGSLVFESMAQRDFTFLAWSNDGLVNSTNSGSLAVQDDVVAIEVLTYSGGSPTGNSISLSFDANTPSSGILVTDSIHAKGMEYDEDYSSEQVTNPRWIADKGYVDLRATQQIVTYDLTGGDSEAIRSLDIEVVNVIIIIKDTDGTCSVGNPITVTTEGGETMDDVLEITLTSPWASLRLYSNGTDLFTF